MNVLGSVINIGRKSFGNLFSGANRAITSKPNLQTDTFCHTAPILTGLFKTSPEKVPELVVMPNVRPDFATRIQECICEFPLKWLEKFKKENYKIIISPTFKDAYRHERVIDPIIETAEKENPFGTLGVTYWAKKGKRFFVFCDKPPYSDKATKNTVFHELSHSIVNSLNLENNREIVNAISKDLNRMDADKTLETLPLMERYLFLNYMASKNPNIAREIIADTYASTKGFGAYGSPAEASEKKPIPFCELFSHLNRKIKNL